MTSERGKQNGVPSGSFTGSPKHGSAERGRTAGSVAGLTILLLAFFSPVLFFGYTYFFRDLHRYFLPYKTFAAAAWHRGEIPLWNPLQFCGMPFLATLQAHILYPPQLLAYVGPLPWGLNVFLVFHVLVAAWGTFALARRWGVSREGAAASGLAWALSGYLLSVMDMVSTLCAVAWLPWLWWAWEGVLQGGTPLQWRRRLALTAACWILMFLGGELTVFYGAGLSLLLRMALDRSWRASLGALGASALWVTVLLAVQWMPFVEFLGQSGRRGGMSFEIATVWSLHPLHLLTLGLPWLTGDVLTDQAAWYDVSQTWLKSLYPGIFVLFLAAWGAKGTWRIPGPTRWLVALVALSLILALGKYTPVYRVLFHAMPGLSFIRYPVKFSFLGAAALALLAGFGWDRWMAKDRRGWGLGLSLLAGVALTAAWVAFWPRPVAAALSERIGSFQSRASDLFATFPVSVIEAHVRAVAWRALAWSASGAALALWWRSGRALRAAQAVLPLLMAGDLAWHGSHLNPLVLPSVVQAPPPAVEHLQAHLASRERFLTMYRKDEGVYTYGRTAGERAWFSRAALNPADHMQFGLESADGYESLVLTRYLRFTGHVKAHVALQRGRVLSAMGVRYAATYMSLSGPLFEREEEDAITLYRYRGPSGRERVVHRIRVARSTDEAVRLVHREGWDPLREAVVEARNLPASLQALAAAPPDGPPSRASVLESGPERVVVAVEASAPGLLVVGDTYYPGWRAWKDGVETTLYPVDVLFRGVEVPAGRSTIELRYEPWTLRAGGWVTAWGWLALAGWCLL